MRTYQDRAEYMRQWRQTPAGRAYAKRQNEQRNERRRKNPDIQRNHRMRHRYGISLEQYNEMLERQGGVCAVCGRAGHTKHPLHVDHDHETGQVRELLCGLCNAALGSLGEDLERIDALASYVRRWKP